MKLSRRKRLLTIIGITVIVSGAALFAYFAGNTMARTTEPAAVRYQRDTAPQATVVSDGSQARIDEAVAANVRTAIGQTAEERLLYLIEEEKMAHDVYITMYTLYGAPMFENISRSETQHQNTVLAVLQDRAIADPRSNEIGVFRDQTLQTLYDSLIAQGSRSLSDAYAVGVKIEEVDIADLTADLKLVDSSDTDVVNTMNILKRGSENHLRAFSRHV